MSREVLAIHVRVCKIHFEKRAKNDQLHGVFLCAFFCFKLPSDSHFVTSKAEKFRLYSTTSRLFENVRSKSLCHYGGVKTSIHLN
jgi:hypothetical protein